MAKFVTPPPPKKKTLKRLNPCPMDNAFHNLVRRFYGHHKHAFSYLPCCESRQDFMGLNTLSLYGHIGLVKGSEPLSQGLSISQFW